jgi:predicted DNA-binding ribbon-helix-helix protein
MADEKASPSSEDDSPKEPVQIERVQTGVRMEKNMVKVLKALAEYWDMSLGQLLEDIVLHAFARAHAFTEDSVKRIDSLKEVYGMNYDVHASYRFAEKESQ